ncbi:hypothetical protein CDL15_Pgr019678 [Punica granatum]|nr:hypothetical protein CDL15_Pgr019678 [Punica granatum]
MGAWAWDEEPNRVDKGMEAGEGGYELLVELAHHQCPQNLPQAELRSKSVGGEEEDDDDKEEHQEEG